MRDGDAEKSLGWIPICWSMSQQLPVHHCLIRPLHHWINSVPVHFLRYSPWQQWKRCWTRMLGHEETSIYESLNTADIDLASPIKPIHTHYRNELR